MSGKQQARGAFYDACAPLRDDGIHIAKYIEQLTALLFLKGVHESPQLDREASHLPDGARWEDILSQCNAYDSEKAVEIQSSEQESEYSTDHEDVIEYYDLVLDALQNDGPFFQEAFKGVSNEFKTPVNFKKTVENIEGLDFWETPSGQTEFDVKGAAYEELLSRYADEAQGAGQYFTPRPLINAIVGAVNPEFGETIHDPAAGTGGFLVGGYQHVHEKTDGFQVDSNGSNLTLEEKKGFLRGLTGVELVRETKRLGAMNMIIHDMRPTSYFLGDALSDSTYEQEGITNEFDTILANPPFGSTYNKDVASDKIKFDGNKRIEFLFVQQIMGRLNENGRAGVIVPEGVLFNSSARSIREELLTKFNLHTVLVLPENSFHPYAGVDANVLFFERDSNGTDEVWYYDARTDNDSINKSNLLTEEHFTDFLDHFDPDEREDCENFFKVDVDVIEENEYDLNYKSYKDFDTGKTHRDPIDVLADLRKTTENIEEELDELGELVGGL